MLLAETRDTRPFAIARDNIKSKCQHYDIGLGSAKLFTDSAITVLKDNIPNLFHNGEIPIMSLTPYEVLKICKDVFWDQKEHKDWAYFSAKAFIDTCLEQNLGITIQ